MNQQTRQELVELVELQVDRSADHATRRRLADLVRDDPEARRFYVEQCELHAMLAWEHGVLPEVPFHGGRRLPVPARWSWSLRWAGWAIAASLLLAVSMRTFRTSVPVPPPTAVLAERFDSTDPPGIDWNQREAIGTVTKSFGGHLTARNCNTPLTLGDVARRGFYELREGIVELQLNQGVKITVKAPSQFEVDHAMRLVLHQGSLAAEVSPEGKGFVVDTPTMSVVDYGTEFGVQVSEDQSGEVHVFKGVVDVRPVHAPPNTAVVRLKTDRATRVDPTGVIPQGIDVDHGRFIRKVGEVDAAEKAYSSYVESLKPTVFLRMNIPEDGRSLRSVGTVGCRGQIEPGGMRHPPFSPGLIEGSVCFGGPQPRSYAWIDDYPKTTTNQLTVAAWVRPESRPRWGAIAKNWAVELTEDSIGNQGLGGQFHFGIYRDDGDLEVQVRDRHGKIAEVREGVPLPLHQWHHVAFIVDDEALSLYRNGQLLASVPCDGVAVDGPERMGIAAKLSPDGRQPDETNPGFWHGCIDELVIFDRALDESELQKLSSGIETFSDD